MKALMLLVWLALAGPAAAQVVVVKSGEHEGFSRLVLELPAPMDWQLGRTAGGYELNLGAKDLRFDLSRVYDLIPRDRLGSIWADPESGNLRLGVDCPCHAIPFEFQPRMIVIDIKDGPPPEGSSFELALDGTARPPLAAKVPARPRNRPEGAAEPAMAYDWLAAGPRLSALPAVTVPTEPAVPVEDPAIAGLRMTLLEQISRGAAQGVVDLAPIPPPPTDAPVVGEGQIRVGAEPGFAVDTQRPPENRLQADGSPCIADDRLDIEAWGTEDPVRDQMASVMNGLLGEFDRPDPEAIGRAVKLYLHLGFGVEARRLMQAYPPDPESAALWAGMAHIVDGDTDATGPFAGMLVCDTAAAMWAVLAAPEITAGDKVRTEAVLRSFSALPLHLRRHLGPALASRFLAAGDTATARTIKDAIRRAGGEAGPEVTLLETDLMMADGDPVAAESTLKGLVAEAGPSTAEAMIALVAAQVAQGATVDGQTVLAIAALVQEHRGDALEPRLLHTQVLALAASGNFDAAFAALPESPATTPELWHLLARTGADSALLSHGVLAEADPLPEAAPADRQKISERLVALGFGTEALRWLTPEEAAAAQVLAASADLARGDAQATLRRLAGIGGADANRLRAQALVQLGDPTAAAEAMKAAGEPDDWRRALGWAQDWPRVAAEGAEPWRTAAALVEPAPPVADAGPLARGTRLLAESAAARATLETLLAEVPAP